MTGTVVRYPEPVHGEEPSPLWRRSHAGRRAGVAAVNALIVVAFILAGWWIEPVRELAALAAPRVPVILFALAAVALAWHMFGGVARVPAHAVAGWRRVTSFATAGAPAAAVLSYLVPIFGGWESARSPYMVGGIIPWSDATLYFGGAERVLFMGGVDEYGAGRPINPAFLAVRLALTGLDLRKALLIGAVLLGLACFFAARTVARDLGVAAGLALFAGVYGFASPAATSVMTESLGVTFGALALACLWKSARNKNVALALAGLVLVTVAQSVRTGTVLLMPALILWMAYHHRGKARFLNWRVLGLSSIAVVLGFAINVGAVLATNGRVAALGGHSGFVLYGLANGYPSWNPATPNWTVVFNDHPGVSMSGADGSKFVNDAATRAIREHPVLFAKTVARSGLNYFRGSHQLALAPLRSAAALRTVIALAVLGAAVLLFVRRRAGAASLATDVILMGATIASVVPLDDAWRTGMFPTWLYAAVTAAAYLAFIVVGTARMSPRAPLGMAVVALVACAASAPLLGTDADSARYFAASVPIMALPLALAAGALVHGRREATVTGDPVVDDPDLDRRRSWTPVLVGAGMVVTALAGAPVAAALIDKPAIAERRCPDGSAAQAFLGGAAIRVVDNARGSEDRLDELETSALEAFLPYGWNQGPASVPGTIAGAATGRTIPPGPKTMLSVITANGDDRVAFVDGVVDAPRGSVLYLCGKDETDGISVNYSKIFWPKPVTYAFFTGSPLPPRP